MAKRISKLAKKIIAGLLSILGLTSIFSCATYEFPDMYGMPVNSEPVNEDDENQQEEEQTDKEDSEEDTGISEDAPVICMYGMPEFLFSEIDESNEQTDPVTPEDFKD